MYMARVVESVIVHYGQAVQWEKVVTKGLDGATRCMELSRKLGRQVPVPSIFIEGELAFEHTPAPEELQDRLDELLRNGPAEGYGEPET